MVKKETKWVYTKLISLGHYQKHEGGLSGKYDNVRIYWENEITKLVLRPFLKMLIERKLQTKKEKIRIIDLGCGAGEGYELIKNIRKKDIELDMDENVLLSTKMIDKYLGIDLNESMVRQAKNIYKDDEKAAFEKHDLRNGLGVIKKDEEPFDIYFSSYASLSHLNDDQLEALLVDIVQHANNESLFVGDWLGQFSIEWPKYWSLSDKEKNKMSDYSMSYLSGMQQKKTAHFRVRYWNTKGLLTLISKVSQKTRVKISPLKMFDRSILVGRHTITRAYNPWIRPTRKIVNKLHEDYVRTDLEELLVKYRPKKGFDETNKFYQKLTRYWNILVRFCQQKLKERVYPIEIKDWYRFPVTLQHSLLNIDRVIDSVKWMRFGDSRANIIEPQLGYALRELEIGLNEGKGYAHGLVGIFKIIK